MVIAFWRKWHRWIGLPATVFLLFASVTGVVLAFTEFFGEAEALREATRDLVSPVTLGQPVETWADKLPLAFRAAAAEAGDAPVDKIEVQFKGDQPTITIFTGKPTGGEDRKFVTDARTGAVIKVESYADKPLLNRIHSGEAFGDGGLVVAMCWGLSLVLLTVTGTLLYLGLWQPSRKGIRKWFW